MRRMTQNAERHNLPTARSAIRMAWQTLSNPVLLQGKRLLTLADIMHSDELQKGLNSEYYRDGYLNVCGAIEQLSELDIAPEEREQAQRLVEILYLWGISLPENLRDGLTAQEVAEAAWLSDDAVGATAQAEHLLEQLVQGGFPIREEKRTPRRSSPDSSTRTLPERKKTQWPTSPPAYSLSPSRILPTSTRPPHRLWPRCASTWRDDRTGPCPI